MEKTDPPAATETGNTAIVQFRGGRQLTVEDFDRYERDEKVYRFYKVGREKPFLEVAIDDFSFVLDVDVAEQKAIADQLAQEALKEKVNSSGDQQENRTNSLELSKKEGARIVGRAHKSFFEVFDTLHEVKPLRIHKPTKEKQDTLNLLCTLANLGARADTTHLDDNIVLTLHFRDLSEKPEFTMNKEAFESAVAEQRIKPVMSPLYTQNGHSYRPQLEGDQVQMIRCSLEQHGKLQLHLADMEIQQEASP